MGAAFCPAFCLGLRGRLADERSFELRGKADLGRGYNQRGERPLPGPNTRSRMRSQEGACLPVL